MGQLAPRARRPTPRCSAAGVESASQPLDGVAIDGDDVEAAGWQPGQSLQVTLGGKHDAPLFAARHGGGGPAMPRTAALADLDKHEGSVRVPGDQVDFAAAGMRPARNAPVSARITRP
jgi:hypothetical protein